MHFLGHTLFYFHTHPNDPFWSFEVVEPLTLLGSSFARLKDVTVRLTMGSRIGVVGRNGAGKSTLRAQLKNLEKPYLIESWFIVLVDACRELILFDACFVKMLIMRLLNLLAGELLPPEDETGEVLQHFQELLFPTFPTFQVCHLWAGQFCVAAPKSSTCLHRSLAVQESTPPMTATPIDQGAASLLPSLWVPEEHTPALLPGAFQAGLEWMRVVWSPTKTPSVTELWSRRKRQVLDVVPMPDHSWSKYIQMVRSCCRHGWDAETQRRLTLPQNEEEAQYRKDAADGHFHGVVDVSMVPIGRRPQELLFFHISFTSSHHLWIFFTWKAGTIWNHQRNPFWFRFWILCRTWP